MKLKNLKTLGAAALTATLLISCNQDATTPLNGDETQTVAPTNSQIIPGQYIVVFDGSKSMTDSYEKSQQDVKSQMQRMMSSAGIKGEILNVYSKSIQGGAIKMSAEDAELMRMQDGVKFIEEDRFITMAPPPGKGPNSGNDGDGGGSGAQTTPYGITRVGGGATYSGSNVAWVIDSGIDLDHADLNVDASRAFNAFTSGKDGKSADDGNGHGTHVAGTIAAIDNDFGVIGVAAGATVIPVKVLDSRGSGSYSGVIAGVDHVAANGSNGDVANMSLGGPVSPALDQAVVSASSGGVKFVLAAGNESDDANNHSPARANGNNVYTISAVDSNDDFAYFSNFGNPPVDYAAPGVAIESTWKGGGYNSISGTSMASPHAAGVLLWGNASTSGTANNDPDGNADPIIVR